MRIVCSVCQIVIVACCFMPLFSPPESVPHSFLLFSSMPPPHRANQMAQRHRLQSVDMNLCAVLGHAREHILLLSSSTNGPLRQGVWATGTTMQLVRRMGWRPPLLYAYPLGHRVPGNLKNH